MPAPRTCVRAAQRRFALIAVAGIAFYATNAGAQSRPAAPGTQAAFDDPNAAEAAAPNPAPTKEALEEASRRYDLGLRLYSEGEFKLAVIEFERSHQLVPDYRVLYNIGQVRIQLGNYARALRILQRYLEEGGDEIAEERREAVENDIEMLTARTGTLRVETSVAGADIVVDDVVVGQSPLAEPLLLDAGEHRITARKVGFEARTVPVTLAGRDALSVKVDLVRTPEQRQTQIFVPQPVVPDSDHSTWQWASWSAAGVFAIGAGVTGGLGIKAANDLKDMRREPGATRGELDSASRRAQTLLLTADVLGGLAIASAGVALYFTLTDPEPAEATPPAPKPAPRAALKIGPGFVGVAGTL